MDTAIAETGVVEKMAARFGAPVALSAQAGRSGENHFLIRKS
jgi:hypothetical protein